MPNKSGRFTPQERAFVRAMVHVNNPTLAARDAGYTQPSSRGGDLMRRPDVVAEVQAAVAHRLKTEGVSVGVGTLIEIAMDKSYAPGPRVLAAKALVQLGGIGAGADDGRPEDHEMSRAELLAVAHEAKRQLAEIEAEERTLDLQAGPAGGVFD